MPLVQYVVDAFTREPFGGNPAAVVPLVGRELGAAAMQRLAAENNLSETAFVQLGGDSLPLRWFTPTQEVDLCGHATLATAFALFHQGLVPTERPLRFATRSGELAVRRGEDERLVMDFPADPPQPESAALAAVEAALGARPLEVQRGRFLLARLSDEAAVRALAPDPRAVAALGANLIATAPGERVDFVSRVFCPLAGIDEDPVTGSAHCTLAPYWSRHLGKPELHAFQVSARGGELWLREAGARVEIAGHCALVRRDEILAPLA